MRQRLEEREREEQEREEREREEQEREEREREEQEREERERAEREREELEEAALAVEAARLEEELIKAERREVEDLEEGPSRRKRKYEELFEEVPPTPEVEEEVGPKIEDIFEDALTETGEVLKKMRMWIRKEKKEEAIGWGKEIMRIWEEVEGKIKENIK